jgi:hypothetical protein
MGDPLKLECFDEDYFTNDCVGECSLTVGDLCVSYGVQRWFPIYYERGKKFAGEVFLETSYTPPVEHWIEDENFGIRKSLADSP